MSWPSRRRRPAMSPPATFLAACLCWGLRARPEYAGSLYSLLALDVGGKMMPRRRPSLACRRARRARGASTLSELLVPDPRRFEAWVAAGPRVATASAAPSATAPSAAARRGAAARARAHRELRRAVARGLGVPEPGVAACARSRPSTSRDRGGERERGRAPAAGADGDAAAATPPAAADAATHGAGARRRRALPPTAARGARGGGASAPSELAAALPRVPLVPRGRRAVGRARAATRRRGRLFRRVVPQGRRRQLGRFNALYGVRGFPRLLLFRDGALLAKYE